jgi:3-deoxy-D-manno-octulosonate 8-phosphate phosphatase KdsC-like HAD superfamily phosphatase
LYNVQDDHGTSSSFNIHIKRNVISGSAEPKVKQRQRQRGVSRRMACQHKKANNKGAEARDRHDKIDK